MAENSLFNTREVIDLLQPRRIDESGFCGQSHFMGSPNIFGGQLLGQSLAVAAETAEGRRPHSLHSLFLLPGNPRLAVEYQVERMRDGGSFSVRRVVAHQEGRKIFVTTISFQDEEPGLSHQKAMPQVPDADSLASAITSWRKRAEALKLPFYPVPVDFRPYNSEAGGIPGNTATLVWTRSPVALPDDVLTHETLFAYVSDFALLWNALLPHGIAIGDPRMQVASLDHTIWFHRPFKMDEWLLFVTESPSASGGRGLCFAHVYTSAGSLIATIAQEGLIRFRKKAQG